MNEGDLLGRAEVSVPEIMGARNWTVTKSLKAQIQNKDYGSITIMGLRVEECFVCSHGKKFSNRTIKFSQHFVYRLQDNVRPDDLLVFELNGIELAAKDHYVYVRVGFTEAFACSRITWSAFAGLQRIAAIPFSSFPESYQTKKSL